VYARAIERRWGEALGRPVVLSPRDWAWVADWHARSIPLSLVLDSIDALRDLQGRRREPRGLAYVAPAVEQAWTALVEGRRMRADASPAEVPTPLETLRNARDAAAVGSPLRVLLDSLLGDLARGGAPEEIDRRLDQILPSSVTDEVRLEAERELDRRLAPYRDRMDADVYARTKGVALVDALRARLRLARLGA
jgi:hypothetical protein